MQGHDLQHPLTDAEIEAKKAAERKSLADRVAELEKAVAELKGKN